jgi:CelD/BcsL family acetyltransferase involved in cellulose biosynthesis
MKLRRGAPIGAHGWTGRVVSIDSLTAAERNIWDEICARRMAVRSAFFSRGFTQAVARSGGPPVFVVVVENPAGAIGFLPFQMRWRGWNVLSAGEKIGGHLSDYCGVIAPATARLSLDAALSLSGLSSFRFDHVADDTAAPSFKDVEIVNALKVEIGESGETYLAQLREHNKDFVREIERRERRLAQELGPLKFEWMTSTPHDELKRVVAIKGSQYERTGKTNILRVEWKRRVLEQLLESDDENCQVTLSTLHAGSTWVASHFGLRCGPTLHAWYPVFDRNFIRYGPGHILFRKLLVNGPAHGVTTLDRGQGENRHKLEYLAQSYTLKKGCWRNGSLLSIAEKTVTSLGWRIDQVRDGILARAQDERS